jgi:hypothetical protein
LSIRIGFAPSGHPANRWSGDDLASCQDSFYLFLTLGTRHEPATPAITLTVTLSPPSTDADTVGEVVASEWTGRRHREIGQAQAWDYPRDRLLMVWECDLFDADWQANPLHDPALAMLWQGVEAELRRRFPATERIVTPGWEEIVRPGTPQRIAATGG